MKNTKDTIKKDTIKKESSYILPFKLWDSEIACALFEFYLYNMANKSDSPLSYDLSRKLDDAQKQALLIHLLDIVGSQEEDFICARFLNHKMTDIKNAGLSDNTLTCDRIKGFLQSPSNTFNFDILMKRIRDAFAHGRIARSGDQAYLILEDMRNDLSGRIVIKNDTLIIWRDEIKLYYKENVE